MITGEYSDLVEAACFYAQELEIADRDFTVDIRMFDKSEEANESGWMESDGSNDFVIYLTFDLADNEDIYEVLAHEMVHVKQYVTGQMQDFIKSGSGIVIWEGKMYDASNDAASWTYWKSPWEMEAFGLQQALNYMRQLKKNA